LWEQREFHAITCSESRRNQVGRNAVNEKRSSWWHWGGEDFKRHVKCQEHCGVGFKTKQRYSLDLTSKQIRKSLQTLRCHHPKPLQNCILVKHLLYTSQDRMHIWHLPYERRYKENTVFAIVSCFTKSANPYDKMGVKHPCAPFLMMRHTRVIATRLGANYWSHEMRVPMPFMSTPSSS